MAQYNYTNNNVNFVLQDNDILQFDKISNASGSIARGDIVPIINAVEIDWNDANLSTAQPLTSWPTALKTTGQLLAAIKYASTHPTLNATDINWNGAKINGETINTTEQLLQKIENLEKALAVLGNNVGTLLGWTN